MNALAENLSARRRLSAVQTAALVVLAAGLAAGLTFARLQTLTALVAFGTAVYCAILVWKTWLIDSAHRGRGRVLAPAEALPDERLPFYSVLVPLFKEGAVVGDLVLHLARLDYPRDRLEVLLLLEEDDAETRAAVDRMIFPEFVRPLVCPPGSPRTKPRACNIGLRAARGELCVVYDAEDRPQLDQLRKAAAAFAALPPQVACLQAKLDFHNSGQNLLTRFFTVEYNHWFDLLLPALSAQRLPIPLGGTSNHFRASILKELAGWDPHNVTEDADLGIRLYASGYETAILDSITWEEACPQLRAWVRQRTRWTKGYIQTFFVHTRSLRWSFRRPRPWRALLTFGALVGGTPLVLLMNPIFVGMLVFHAITRSHLIVELMPRPVLYPAVISLVVGNGLLVYTNLLGVDTRRRWHLARAAISSPLYWALMSAAAWRALIQFAWAPHRWEKTPHGLAVR